jgi:enoyl-CoA hydratase/carnithine racemase
MARWLGHADLPPDDPGRGNRIEMENAPMTDLFTNPLVESVIVDPIGKVVRLECTAEGMAVVTIDRPADHNALNGLAIEGLTEAFETLQGAEGVRIVFLRGAGGTFCAGADLAELRVALADWTEDDNRADARAFAAMLQALADIPAVTVALVEGATRSEGVGLVAACDIAVAAADATFAFAETKRGLIPAMIAPYVVEAIGPRIAKALFVTGQTIDAIHAQRLGLVHEIAADAAGMDHAMDRLFDGVMTGAPDAIAEAKRLVWDLAEPATGRSGLTEELAIRLAHRRVSDEGKEGVDALLNHRKPSWIGSERIP